MLTSISNPETLDILMLRLPIPIHACVFRIINFFFIYYWQISCLNKWRRLIQRTIFMLIFFMESLINSSTLAQLLFVYRSIESWKYFKRVIIILRNSNGCRYLSLSLCTRRENSSRRDPSENRSTKNWLCIIVYPGTVTIKCYVLVMKAVYYETNHALPPYSSYAER